MAHRRNTGGKFRSFPPSASNFAESPPGASQHFNYQARVPRGGSRGHGRYNFKGSSSKEIPGSDVPAEDIFTFPYLDDGDNISFIKNHGRILFLIRGPPGTAKDSLVDVIQTIYPASKVFSAKRYEKVPFVKKANYKDTTSSHWLRQSHNWCLERLQESMNKDEPILILSNSHVRAKEIDFYLDIVRTYAYTIVVAETIWKFNVSQKVLANTNQQSLDESYFESRLKQWDVYVPWYTGWFLNPADSLYLQNLAYSVVDHLLDKGNLRTELNLEPKVSSGRALFSPEKELFAICFCCHSGFSNEGQNHYGNKEVIENIGKLFTISILGFIVDPHYLLAMVKLEPEQVALYTLHQPKESSVKDPESKDNDGDKIFNLEAGMQNLRIHSRNIDYADLSNMAIHSKGTLSAKGANPLQATWPEDLPKLEELSLIVIGASGNPHFPYIENPRNFLHNFFSHAGRKSYSSPSKIDKGTLYKVDFGKYIFFPNEILSFKCIFTGLY